jgi:SAM-dependent methyltransferase
MTSANVKLMSTCSQRTRRRELCISCGAELQKQVFNFGAMPISNSLARAEDLGKGETFYPLRIVACETCALVQLADPPPAEAHFHSDYVYFSSFSAYGLAHSAAYTDTMIKRFRLAPGQQVLEIGSNDGYLLTSFQTRGLRVLGIEPSESVARAAIAKGIPTQIRFFGSEVARELATQGVKPRLIAANNVFAHVPDLNDFTQGFALLLSDDAVLIAEVHYFRALYEQTQFDSFYHEHYSYYTIRAAERLFARHGLRLFDVERIPTHGGSIRLFVCRKDASFTSTERLKTALAEDDSFFKGAMSGVDDFADRVFTVCDDLRRFLMQVRRQRSRVAAFGAPAKATTMLNFASVTPDLLPYTVDSNPTKQGRYIPGVYIPILAPEVLLNDQLDYVLVLPWNIRKEIVDTVAPLRSGGTTFVCAIPRLEIF